MHVTAAVNGWLHQRMDGVNAQRAHFAANDTDSHLPLGAHLPNIQHWKCVVSISLATALIDECVFWSHTLLYANARNNSIANRNHHRVPLSI